MPTRSRAARGALVPLLVALGLGACGAPPAPTAPAPSATPVASAAPSATPVAVADPPMPSLRTGALAPVEARAVVEGRVVARHLGDVVETLAVEIVLPNELEGNRWSNTEPVVAVDGASPGPYSFIAEARPGDRRVLWIRRPKSAAGSPVAGKLFGAHREGEPGVVARFQAPAPAASVKSDPAALADFGRALADDVASRSSAWSAFAADRMRTLYAEKPKPSAKKPARGPARPTRPVPVRAQGDLGRLMETTTGVASIQEALQSDRPLLTAAAREKPSVPIASLARPKSAPHPWDDLLASLPKGGPAPKEALAAATPAEFWYVRAKGLDVVFRMADELDRWATPAVDALDGRAEERNLSGRYEAELGVGRSAIARALGPDVVGEVALVGSDPYLREGSDVTAIFQLKSRAAFEAALVASVAGHQAAHGKIDVAQAQIAGVDVRVSTSADGVVRQHRATVGDLAIVSNSRGAMERVLEALAGKRPRLSDEKDLAYLLARDPGARSDAFAFMGDRFVAEVTGPRQKVLEARRQLALAELETPALAALLHGWLFGASPASADDLVKSGLLAKEDLAHGRGGAITWKPGEAPRSSWGSPTALVPLVDLPAPDLVTPSERDAYERFARGYESYWQQYIDPAALRVTVDGEGDATKLTADLRVLPLIEGTEYRRIADVVGGTRLDAPALASGARMTLALGVSAGLRRELSGMAGVFTRRRELDLDWLGDYALLGVLDRTPAAVALHDVAGRSLPERPMTEEEREARRERDVVAEAAKAPLYAAIGVKSPAAAALALAAARAIAEDSLPGMVSWGELGKHRDATIVRVAFDERRRHRDADDKAPDTAPEVTLYYALTGGALVFALDEQAIRKVIDEIADGRAPKAVAKGTPGGAQHVVDLAFDKGGALRTVMGWLLEGEVVSASDRSRAAAEVLLRGAPEVRDAAAQRALGLAYLGAAPLAPDGGAYTLAPDGVRDPARGTQHAPIWPAVPVPGSPIDKLLGAVRSFRSELSVEREGPARRDAMQSLHARVTLGLGAP